MPWTKVASLADLPVGGMLRAVVGLRKIALYNVDGTVYATNDECSHAVASLSTGELDGHTVTCPRHGARFDVRTGKNLCFPAVVPVRSYPARLDGEDVFVELP